ncbi:uncharacterized protein BT62DRAFT_597245 [Guyanagaster necrorhizus]|uniref:Uncharacterized protein n=1 Tax=Guyanagaster necrorhizus TaxID=856835 RepID=A0A9P7W068_9AGAR|nr:uncharacterized protein BT62DRAFT_597245 [Guyanagaster necrorhizus MCA 3950]KAG7449625.1 hypothetical protein BT62DRAFT_597245 [Guyanagaster necrorhizus MCA 3950]
MDELTTYIKGINTRSSHLDKANEYLRQVFNFVHQHVVNKPLEAQPVPLELLIFTIDQSISPLFVVNAEAYPNLLDLIASVEQYRRTLLKKAEDAIVWDKACTGMGRIDEALTTEERASLYGMANLAAAQRELFIAIVADLCKMDIFYLLRSEDHHLTDVMLRLSQYFPWLPLRDSVPIDSPFLFLRADLDEPERNLLLEAGKSCYQTLVDLYEWTKKQNSDEYVLTLSWTLVFFLNQGAASKSTHSGHQER